MLVKLFILFILSFVLHSFDLGYFWQQIQPFWLLLFYFLFLIHNRTVAPFYTALLLGLLFDIMNANILGQTSLALIVSSYIILYNRKYIIFANSITVAIYLVIITLIYLIILLIPQIMIQGFDINYLIFISPLSTALFYMLINHFFSGKLFTAK